MVVDEAQAIKNAATRQAEAVRSLPARHRIAVTGTPVENRLADLWSIMQFANPACSAPAATFRKRYAEPIERHGDAEAARRLRRITGPFVLRRLKTDSSIITDLPEKLEMEVLCNLTAEQAALYRAIVDDMLAKIESSDGIERRGPGAGHDDQAQAGLQPPGPTAARRLGAGGALRQARPAGGDPGGGAGGGGAGAALHPVRRVRRAAARPPVGPLRP